MRKLMWCAVGYCSAIAAAHYLLPFEHLPWFAAGCAVLALTALFFRSKLRLIFLLMFLSAGVGFIWSWGHEALFLRPAEELIGCTLEVDARVVEYPVIDDDYSSVEVRLTEDWAPRSRVIVYDYNGAFSELKPGDELKIELRFISARVRNNTETDYYISDGVFLRAYLDGVYSINGKWDYNFLNSPKYLAHLLKAHVLAIFPDDAAPLMKALLTGDKAELYDDDALYTAMKTAGFSHIIAVSGMHVSFILGMLRLWTGRRRLTAIIGIPLIWFFAAMWGFTPSVIRASAMISLLLLAPLLRRENDAPTSLSAALLLLTLANPQAIGSISLQLSFAAMAGIIAVTPAVYRGLNGLFKDTKGIAAKILRFISSSLSASIGAIVFTTPLLALHFGYVPLYSVVTNLLCLWAMSYAFMAGYLACIVGAVFFPAGQALAWLIAWLVRYTIFIVKLIAALPFAALSTRNNYVAWWLISVYAVFIISWLCRGKRPYRPVIPICICIVGFLAVTVFITERPFKGLEITAVDVGQGQCIIATAGDAAVVIDCGARNGSVNAGDQAADTLLASGRDSVDLLILTHLHADHANGVVRLMNRIDVDRLVLPEDCEDTEFRDSILELCYDKGTEIYIISQDYEICVGELDLTVFAPIGSDDLNERGLIILGGMDDYEFLVTGDAGSGTEKLFASFYEFPDTELLVVGHHGSKYSACDELLNAVTPDCAIISVGINSYGHPAEEVLERLNLCGIEIRRTDLEGTITIKAGYNNG